MSDDVVAVTTEDIDGPDPVEAAFAERGIDLPFLATKLKQELCARRAHYVREAKPDPEDAEYKVAYETVDWQTRQGARKDAHKLLGHYPNEKLDLKATGSVHINLIEQDGCPELPRAGRQPVDNSATPGTEAPDGPPE